MRKVTFDPMELAAKWLTVANTGWMGKPPESAIEVEMIYAEQSEGYRQETGEGLNEERKWWAQLLGKKDCSALQMIKEDLPWLDLGRG